MARKLAEVSNSNPSKEDLSEQVATLRQDVAALTDLLGEFGKAKSAELTNTAKEKLNNIRDEGQARATAAADAATEKAAELHGQANDFVKAQPATALGIAAGLGFLVGFMSGRK